MEIFVWPSVVLILGVLSMLLFKKDISSLLRRAKKIGREGIETVSSELQKNPQAKSSAEDLMRAFDSVSLRDNEKRIREDLEKRNLSDPQEAIDVLIRHLAVYQLSYYFEYLNLSVYGSQISLLQHLNSKSLLGETADGLRYFYTNAADQYPETYGNYPFEDYLNFLINVNFIQKNDELYLLTALGRDFLVYLVNTGMTIERKN